MKVFAIQEDFANAVLRYLAKMPYVEVHEIIKGFQDLRTLEDYNKEGEI